MKKLLIVCLLICAGCGSHIRIPDFWQFGQDQGLFPFGMVEFSLNKVSGQCQTVFVSSVTMPADTKWYMLDVNRGGYLEMPMVLDGSRKRITLTFVDGGLYDLLHKHDGGIQHIGGPSFDKSDLAETLKI